MFWIVQNIPEEKVLFATNSEKEAEAFFDLQIKHSSGWFELWEEGKTIPHQVGGEQFYSPYRSEKWDILRLSAALNGNQK